MRTHSRDTAFSEMQPGSRINRRLILNNGLAAIAAALPCIAYCARARGADAGSPSMESIQTQFDQRLATLQAHQNLLTDARAYREAEAPQALFGRVLPMRPGPSKTKISDRAVSLIVTCEVTSQRKYEQSYQRPTWPGGSSGVTIGIGYDVGYVTVNWLSEDWQGYISGDAIDGLGKACGVTGRPAQQLNATLQNTVINWPIANRQFMEQVLPRYVGETEGALANTGMLSSDSLGALVSLVYNRGASFDIPPAKDPSGRYKEMRAIKAHMEAKALNLIPAEIRSMERLWKDDPSLAGLIERRELEATLFELGLQTH